MTEYSYYWSQLDPPVGDGVLGPYSDEIWSDVHKYSAIQDVYRMGVIKRGVQFYDCSISVNQVTISPGYGYVQGRLHMSNGSEDFAVTTPISSTRIDLVVLRKDWATQEIRLTLITGVEGAGAPALTQVDGAAWDIPLWEVTITTGSSISIVDMRHYVCSNLAPMTGNPMGGRLTLETDVPVSVTDQSAKDILYYTPYLSTWLRLWDTSRGFANYEFEEMPVDVSGLVANSVYDIFIEPGYGPGGFTVTPVIWASAVARASALIFNRGVFLQTGFLNRNFLGTIRINSTGGEIEDTLVFRGLWNNYNRVPRLIRVREPTASWVYGTGTFRIMMANTLNKAEFVIGRSIEPVEARQDSRVVTITGEAPVIGIGLDALDTLATDAMQGIHTHNDAETGSHVINAHYAGFPGIGYHYLAPIEKGSGSADFYGGDYQLFKGVIYG